MTQSEIKTSALIEAPPDRIYAIIADYRDGHPRILPKPYFVAMQVEQGGVGRGTVVNFQMKLMGRLRNFRAQIREPEPGRVLEEVNEDGAVTRFIVAPRRAGQAALVTILTTLPVRAGFAGRVEGWLAGRLLRPVYEKELQQLAEVAASWGA